MENIKKNKIKNYNYSHEFNQIGIEYISAIELLKSIEEEQIKNLIEFINQSNVVRLLGTLTDALLCKQLKNSLLRYGIYAEIIDEEEQLKKLNNSKKGDINIIFSSMLGTKFVDKAINISCENYSKVAIITMNEDSEYIEKSDIYISLPRVKIKNNTLLSNAPIFFIFIEILLYYFEKNILNKEVYMSKCKLL